jgi:uncharacterized protein YyaL (SSP411 family)
MEPTKAQLEQVIHEYLDKHANKEEISMRNVLEHLSAHFSKSKEDIKTIKPQIKAIVEGKLELDHQMELKKIEEAKVVVDVTNDDEEKQPSKKKQKKIPFKKRALLTEDQNIVDALVFHDNKPMTSVELAQMIYGEDAELHWVQTPIKRMLKRKYLERIEGDNFILTELCMQH